ncbi:DNA-dependent protein kinase catalytic subunit-like [Onthophagus taurus]|uniref:DNA-dependent protein kinase catalytic subunit-like n=1 Tax=Onthophagus taurus TaxID=166361 RepID=UPI0039BE37DD
MEEDFIQLQSYIKQENFKDAETSLRCMQNISEKDYHETAIDEYLLNAFDETNGLLIFILKIKDQKNASNAIAEALEVLHLLVKELTRKVHRYVPDIRQVCLKVVLTDKPSAKAKERALELLALILEKTDNFSDDQQIKELYETLYYCFTSNLKDKKMGVLALVIKTLYTLISNYFTRLNSCDMLCKEIFNWVTYNCARNDSIAVIEQSFRFFDHYLFLNNDDNYSNKIYDCIIRRLRSSSSFKNSHIAALEILQHHSSYLYRENIFDAKYTLEILLLDCLEQSGEIQKTAYYTLDVFYQTLGDISSTKTDSQISKFYLDKFITDINNEEKHGYELRLSIRGFGYFAKCFKIHLKETVITDFLNVILKIEKTYLLDFDENSSQLSYLPDYVQTLSKIVEQLDSLSRHDIMVLQRITILLIRLSPYLSAHHPDFVVSPILIAFNFARKFSKNISRGFLQNVIYEGIIFSCSHQIAYDLNEEEISYKDYIKLWVNLVSNKKIQGEKILEEIFDELIITLFCLLSKLNLNIQQVESYEVDNVAKISFEAVNVPDFNIFVNMVDLYVEILKAAPKNKFSKCVKKYFDFIITESKKSPLISGFYKLIAIGLELCNNLNYFSIERLRRNDIKCYYDIIEDFMNTIIIKIESYKDDLKLSCLKVVLAAPEVYVKQNLKRLSPAIISLFNSSRSNLTLAISGVDTLELWNKFLPAKEYDDFLTEIVPTLDSYLRSKPLSENVDTSHIKQRKTKQPLYRRKITKVSEGDLLQLQKKILSFLGNVNGNVLFSLTENNNKIDEEKLGDNLNIKIDLNFDTTITIYIEKFIPRVIDLALNCSERKLQITACETLHAFVIVFLGTSRVDDQKNLDDQFKKMFYPLLQLGCYLDDTVKQIIKPLVEQLIHWYSTPNQRNSPKLAILIESLLDAITQRDDISLRDFSCHCIHELIKYSLKYCSGRSEDDYSNVRVIIRKIKMFCYHSNPLKRLAGSLIFNNIYTLLREENVIVDTYWLDLFQSLIYNLSQIDEHDEYDCLLNTIKSIDHLERVFKEKSGVFNKSSRNRKLPNGFLDETLSSVVSASLNYRNAKNRKAKMRIYEFYYNVSKFLPEGNNQIVFSPYFATKSIICDSKDNNFSFGDVMSFLKKLLNVLDTELSIYEHEKSKHLYKIDQNFLKQLKFYFESIYPYNLSTINPKKSNVTDLDNMVFKRLNHEVLKCSMQYLIISSFYENNDLIEEFTKNYGIKLLSEFIFNVYNVDFGEEEIVCLLKKVVKDDQIKLLTMEINEFVSKSYSNLVSMNETIRKKEKDFLRGLKLLLKIDFLPSLQIGNYLKNILHKSIDNLKYKDSIKLNVDAKKYFQSIIELDPVGNIEYLLKCLCETKEVLDEDKNEMISFGLYFYDNFKDCLLPIILPYFQVFFDMIKFNSNYLYFTKEIIKYALNKTIIPNIRGKIAEIILNNWNNYCFNSIPDGLQTLELITQLINDVEINSSNNFVTNWILLSFNLLDSAILPQRLYQHIEEILNVLPLIVKYKQFETFKDKLEGIKNDYFVDINEIDSATLVINKSFQISITSKLQELFMFSCEIYATSNLKENINVEEYIQFFMISVSNEVQSRTLINIFKYFVTISDFNSLKSFDVIASNLLRYSTYDVFENFYDEYIKNILVLLEKDYIQKSIGFILIKCLFSRIGKKDKLTKDLFGMFALYLKEPPENESSRISKCHCYNALISVVTNGINSDLKASYYNKLFFRGENENILWKNLIDLNNKYVFPILFDKLPEKTTRLVNIRTKEINRNNRYLESQSLYNSTLREDFHRYDFTKVIIRSQESQGSHLNESEEVEMKIIIEGDEISNHECMPYIRGLIKRIHEEKIYENHSNEINKDLKNPKTHVNVKLFLLKIIESEEEIFKDFSPLLSPTIINLIVDTTVGSEINYFIGDLIIMLTSWNNFDFQKHSNEISNLVLFFMENINRERNDVKKYHLNLFKLIVETWRNHIKAPTDFIFDELQKLIKTESKKVEIIIHFCSIFLANDIEPWGNELQKFVKIVLNCLQSTQKSIQKTCSQTIGMALKLTEKNQNRDFKIFKKKIIERINEKFPFDNYLGCLQGFLTSYPEICDHLLNKLILAFNSQKVTLETKRVALLVFSERTEALNSNHNFELLQNFEQFINDYDDGLKLLGMKVILKSISKINFDNNKIKFKSALNNLSKLINNNNKDCRSSMYDIFIEINEIINDDDTNKLSLDCLLKGLNDPEEEIQNKLIEFFLKKLPNENVSKKFLQILTKMYKPELEDRFLSYSIVLLLNNLDISTLLFNTPLRNADFSERTITDNWRGRHSSLAPLFASTYRSQQSQEIGKTSNESSRGSFDLKATLMDLEFEPTYQPDNEKREMNEKDDDDDLDVDFKDFKVPAVPGAKKMWKQRFQKDSSKVERGFALGQLTKKEKMEKKRIDDLKQRQEKAVIYRRYRDGEIPDIEICLADLMVPLKKLIQHDYHIAEIFYTSFFKDILKQNNEDQNFILEITSTINEIFKSSITYNSYFMSSLLNVILKIPGSSFSPETITTVASNSGLISSGILILEEYLISQHNVEIPSKRKPSSNAKLKIWVNLANLYREIKEWDTVKAIFVQKMECENDVLKAIDYESKGEWREAEQLYNKVLQNDPCSQRRDFYYESFFKCYAEMSKWEEMTVAIQNVTSNNVWEDLWDNDFNQRKLLPWYISAELRNGLQNPEIQKEFLKNLNNSMSTEKAIYLKQHFSEELGFIHLINQNYHKALYYIKYNLEKFLDDWRNTSPMLVKLRSNMMIKIVNSIDLFNFINKINNNVIENEIGEEWRKFYQINSISIVPIESRYLYRTKCLNLIEDQSIIDTIKFDLDVNLIENAVNMKNFYVASKYFSKIPENITNIKLKLAYAKMLMLKSHFLPIQRIYRYFEESYRVINNIDTENIDFDLKLSTFRALYDILFDFAKNSNQFELELKQLIPDLIDYSEKTIKEYGVNKLRNILSGLDLDDYNKTTLNLQLIGDSYVKLAIFYKSYDDNENYITSVLRSMYFESKEGRQMFPCLLDIKNVEEYKETFLKQSENIPIWLFIQWIPQLLSKIDSNCIFVIDKIILKIAKSYPQSIMYPYKLSKEKVDLNVNYNQNLKLLLSELDDLLLDKNADDLIEALSSVVSPKSIITSCITDLLHSCYLSDQNLFNSHLNNLKTRCIKTDDPLSKIGSVQKQIIELSKDLIKLERDKFNPAKLIEKLQSLKSNINNVKEKIHSRTLSYFSPYLSFFMDNQEDVELEIPGQYKGDRPFPQYHVKIAGFSPEILIMESKRTPIRIKIIGNDGKEYPFLIKVGEDLRQDQRIEQMFTLMNEVFNSNATCRERRLKISTYQVIPLTKSLGLIEWVENTIPLRKFLINNQKSVNKQLDNIKTLHQNRYSLPKNYSKALIKHKPETVINLYRELVNKIPTDIFRKALWSLSVDSESFISIRTTFITSYISTCIANWILGIGDRHLENTLICLNTARTIDIDFGHAFGVGVQIQSIPELVPFRLTPHLVSLMQPLEEHGLIEQSMIHILRALRDKKNSLISTVKVFINEPSMDWVQYKKFEDLSKDSNFFGYNWCGEEKIRHVEMKLNGVNSVEIMVEELKKRKDDGVIEKYVEYVRGYEGNVRSGLNGLLSVEDQVKSLLDHATDPNLLCRMYLGWEPWV